MFKLSRRAIKQSLSRWPMLERGLERLRLQLASADALGPLLAMAFLTGICAGLVTVAFRLASEIPTGLFLPLPERYEMLPAEWRFGVPVVGALVLAGIVHLVRGERRTVGVVHVLDRLHNHQARMPMPNAILQFVAGSVALISGQSVGREGPTVHLGAASGSWVARRLGLPNNSARNLLGCGVAAAIAASFNTPLAGVVFAMEVVMLEYTVAGFLPVILAAVTGSVITQLSFGREPVFNVPAIHLNSLAELPALFLCALAIGVLAAVFIQVHRRLALLQRRPAVLRFLAAGLLTGALAIWVPQILGTGYDTVELAMLGQLAVGSLLVIVLAKAAVTAVATGLGIPGGVIGPSLFLGACMGGLAGGLANLWLGEEAASPGFYAMVGMAAMMAALLDAPLAALLAILELTYNPNVLFPGMMMIVVACLVTRYFFGTGGIFQETLRAFDKSGTPSWRQQMLNRTGVASVMERGFVVAPESISLERARQILSRHPVWILIEREKVPLLLRAADLAGFLLKNEETLIEEREHSETEEAPLIELKRLPGERLELAVVNWRATLLEAQHILEKHSAGALCVVRGHAGGLDKDAAGIILPADIDNFYRK